MFFLNLTRLQKYLIISISAINKSLSQIFFIRDSKKGESLHYLMGAVRFKIYQKQKISVFLKDFMCSFIHKKGPQNPVIGSFVVTYIKYLSFCLPTLFVVYPIERNMGSLPFFSLPIFFYSLCFGASTFRETFTTI